MWLQDLWQTPPAQRVKLPLLPEQPGRQPTELCAGTLVSSSRPRPAGNGAASSGSSEWCTCVDQPDSPLQSAECKFLASAHKTICRTHLFKPARYEGQTPVEAFRLCMHPDLLKRAVSAAGSLMCGWWLCWEEMLLCMTCAVSACNLEIVVKRQLNAPAPGAHAAGSARAGRRLLWSASKPQPQHGQRCSG